MFASGPDRRPPSRLLWSLFPLALLQPGSAGPVVLLLIAGLLLIILRRHPVRWQENGAEILTLDRIRSSLARFTLCPIVSRVAPDTPILLAPDADPGDPSELEIALWRSGLRIQPAGGHLEIGPLRPPRAFTDTMTCEGRVERAEAAGVAAAGNPGTVAIHGQFLAHPVRIEGEADAISIDGQSVFPPAGPDEETQLALDALMWDLRRNSDATFVDWRSEHVISIGRVDGTAHRVGLGSHRDEPPARPAERRTLMALLAAGLRSAREEGRVILVGHGYLRVLDVENAEATRRRVCEIASSDENDLLRVARIQAHTGHRRAALDILEANLSG